MTPEAPTEKVPNPSLAIHPTANTFYSSIILFKPMHEMQGVHLSVAAEMGISAYQIDMVIKAYNKQSRLKFRRATNPAPSPDKYADIVALSSSEGSAAETYNKISYSLVGDLLKDKKTAM